MLEDGPSTCEKCGGQLRRVFFPAGIIFKGSGFYKTDSRSAGQAASSGATTKAGSGEPSSGGTPTGGEASTGGATGAADTPGAPMKKESAGT